MAGLQDMLAGNAYESMQALMSPEFNKVLDNRIATRNNASTADPNLASMSLSEALGNIGDAESCEVTPRYEAMHVAQPMNNNQASLKAGVITEARDFSYLDGSNMHFETPKQEDVQITPQMIKESKLPDFMKQSFLETPPVSGVLPKDNVDLFAEQLIAKGIIPKKKEQPQQKKVLKESTETKVAKDGDKVPTKYYDYQSNDIQAIVEEVVKKQVNILYKQLKKDMVSVANQIVDNCAGGSSLTTIKVGDALRFVDTEGNVFEADLHFVGNKKQKK